MKSHIHIIAKNHSGQLAVMNIETDSPWLALRVEDASQMEGFTPSELVEFLFIDKYGGSIRHVLSTEDETSK